KALGIKMGVPLFQVRALTQRHDVVIRSTDFTLYRDLSNQVMNTLTTFSPEVEVYSVDEAFLNLRGLERLGIENYAAQMHELIKTKTGIPISVGLAKTKTLAKLASHVAKKSTFRAVSHVFTESSDIRQLATQIDVSDVWGIGRKYSDFLYGHGVQNVNQLMDLPEAWVKRHLKIVGWRTYKELHGVPCIPLQTQHKARQSIQTARTFTEMQTKLKPLEEMVAAFASRCAFELRMEEGCSAEVIVFLGTNRHREDLRQVARSFKIKFETPTNSSIDIVAAARAALCEAFLQGYHYKRAGVILSGIVPEGSVQLSLFDDWEKRAKHQRLMSMVDKINTGSGRDTTYLASQGTLKMRSFYNTFRPDDAQDLDELT
ncbi:MAG: SOS mutagenesis and repair protein UmuC, partial [Abditibacteriaceae bacterium]